MSRKTVQVTPGFSRNVSVSGIPPFRMEMGPDPTVASALFVDSTVSPAFIIIMAPSTSHIGDLSSFVLSDLCVSETITINITSLPSVTSYSDDIQPIWDLNCQYRGCHPGGGSPFSLDPIVSWSNLYYAEVSNITCGPIYRVVPGNADSSLLYLLISGQSSCPRMPLTGSGDTLSLVDQDLIKSWIEDGAPNN